MFVTLFFYNRNLLSYLQAQSLFMSILTEVIILQLIGKESKIHNLPEAFLSLQKQNLELSFTSGKKVREK